MAGCETCGEQLAPSKGARLRKYCSERCRKAQYDLVCIECGGRASGTDPGKMANPEEPVCRSCAGECYATWTREAIALRIETWADENGGIPPSSADFTRARAGGLDVPTITTVQGRFGTWSEAVRAAGLEPFGGGSRGGTLTTGQRAEIARRYAAGQPSTLLAAEFDCSPGAVIRWARFAGVEIRPPFGRAA